jgi:hypothetical protein
VSADEIEVQLTLVDPDDDALDVATGTLRRRLAELDEVASVRRPTATAPDGTRGIDAATIGSLIVSLTSQPAVLGAVVSTVTSWLRRHDGRKVRIQIGDDVLELDGASVDDQRRLVELFVERHGGQAP